MNRTNQTLAVVLVVQLVIVLVTTVFADSGSETGDNGPLLPELEPDTVTALTVTDDSGQTIRLERDGETWTLPDAGNYPAQGGTINQIINRLALLDTGRLITTSETSHRQLGVADDEYQRLLEIEQDGETLRLYMGTPGGPNATHVRLDEQDNVYLGDGIAVWEVNATAASWVDTAYFSIPQESITAITVENGNGIFEFTRDEEGTWTLEQLTAGETLDNEVFNALLGRVASITLIEPLGTETDAAYGLDTPAATVTISTRESLEANEEPIIATYTIRIGEQIDNGYAVKASNTSYYALVSTFTAETIIDYTLEDFTAESTPELVP